MRNPVLRRTLRLTVTLLGLTPPVWREIVVDRDLTLAELHSAIALAFDWPEESHHVFTDREPPGAWDDPPCQNNRSTRRWGDRWTMIDWRDPTVVESHTVTLAHLLDDGPLFYGCTVADRWWCRIEARGDDMDFVDAPVARLTTGSGRAPIPEGPGPDELPAMHQVLSDPADPDHDEVRRRFARLVGPWTDYAPSSTDLDGARRAVAERFGGTDTESRSSAARGGRKGSVPARTRLEAVADAVPPAARVGLRHAFDTALRQNPTIPAADIVAETIRPFSWLVAAIGEDGAALQDRYLAPAVYRAGAEEAGLSADDLPTLVDCARTLRLVRRFRGRLILLAAAEPVRRSPSALWTHLAEQIWDTGYRYGRSPDDEMALLLLAIADGSLSDPTRGERHLHAALDLLTEGPHRAWDHDDGGSSWAGFSTPRRELFATPPERDVVARVGRVEVLRFLGLVRSADGTWQTPPGLRAFARHALTREIRTWWG